MQKISIDIYKANKLSKEKSLSKLLNITFTLNFYIKSTY